MVNRRKTVREHKLAGTFVPCRHGRRRDVELTRGRPRRPRWLVDPEAVAFWNRVVPQLVKRGTVFREDAEALASMARWWADWQQAQRLLRRVAHANDIDERRKVTLLAARAWNECENLMGRFGLLPGQRAALKDSANPDGPDGGPGNDPTTLFFEPPGGDQ